MEKSQAAETHADAVTPVQTKAKKVEVNWWDKPLARKSGTVLGISLLAGLLVWWFAFRPFVSTDDARVAMTLIRLAPSGVGGRIEKVNVVEGTRVKTGDVLVEIDHRIPQANFDRAKAKAVLAEREFTRLQRLTAEGSATQQSLDQARASFTAADVELKLAEVALENTYLKAPFDGVIVQKLAEVGNLLEPSQTAVVVADDKHAWVAANIEETSVGDVQLGQPVKIKIDEGGSATGKVSEIRSTVASQFALIPSDSGSGNFTKVVQRVPIKVAVDGAENLHLRAGQSVEIKVRVH